MEIKDRCKVYESEYDDFSIDFNMWEQKKPHGLSGCFRVRNEQEFLAAAVESHIEYLDEVVIVLQPSEDDSLKVCDNLKLKYPDKVRVYPYPFKVHGIGTPGHFESPENSVYTMMHLTNYAISRCMYSWIAKIEGDVIAYPSFKRCRDIIDQYPREIKYYGRVGLNVAGLQGDEFSANAPRNAGWDEAIFNNNPFWYCYRADKWESMNFHRRRELIFNLGWSFIHVKRCKEKHQRLREVEPWEPLNHERLILSLNEYRKRYPWPSTEPAYEDFILDAPEIIEKYRKVGEK